MAADQRLVMQARGLVKRYGHVTALDGADFELRAGEILAVIGDNGAGKSSLIKALSGATIPDDGEILLDGKPIRFRSPIDARRAGIETVYQDLAVAAAMTIAENLFLGREVRRPGFLGNVLNPKAAAVYLTLVPQFLDPHGAVAGQVAVLAAAHAAVAVTWLTVWTFVVAAARHAISSRWFKAAINRVSGMVLVALGVRTAVSG